MRLRGVCGLISIAAILGCAGCAANRANNVPVAIAAPAAPAPLNLCPDPAKSAAGEGQSATASAAANQPGYTQLAISVTDAAGRPVPDLRQSDFAVDLLGQHLPIVYFAAEDHDAPTSLVIVTDDSGSMHGKLVAPNDMLPAIRGKISAVVGTLNRCDELALVSASGVPLNGGQSEPNKVRVVQPFTTNHALLLSDIYAYTPQGETSLYDAIDMGLQTADSAHYRQRALIVITDGIDNTSTMKKDQLSASLRRSRVEFFVIGIGDPSVGANSAPIAVGPFMIGTQPDLVRLDAQSLSDLSAAANGQLIEAEAVTKDQGQSFAQALQKISDNLGSSYLIGVVVPPHVEAPSAPPNVILPNHPGTVVTTRMLRTAQWPQS